MIRGEESVYTEQRVPSFCDRILFTSLPSRRDCIEPLYYQSAPSVLTR